jgi:1-acyl-sn-glycerol-3-phosphate acyltransferase
VRIAVLPGAFLRLLKFGWMVTRMLLEFAVRIWLCGRASDIRARAAWLQKWSDRTLRFLRVRVERRGHPPLSGILVSNHLSYLDILVFASAQPMVFLAKSEVRRWPVCGWLARCGGTLFINRNRKTDVIRAAEEFRAVIDRGVVLGLFPEGTSSDGRQVLPFRSSLFEPASREQWPVSPAWIGYRVSNGSVEDDVCYWRDMTFLPHFLGLLTRDWIEATVLYGSAAPAARDRKEMARELHSRVCELAQRGGGGGSPAVKPGRLPVDSASLEPAGGSAKPAVNPG